MYHNWLLSKIVTHAWDVDNCLWFHVRWGLGNLTWEPLSNVDDIAALDEYLTQQDIDKVENLQRIQIPSEPNSMPVEDLPRSASCRWHNVPMHNPPLQVIFPPHD